jgi:nitrate reductase gamma subunit
MNPYLWFATSALVICLASCFYHFFRLLEFGKPQDYSKPLGEITPAVKYSFTRAMDPRKKESAFLHLPTYTAGIIYHLGTFLSIALFTMFWLKYVPSGWFKLIIIGFLFLSSICGLSILVKRIIKKNLRTLSNPDDYISNFLVTAFHFITALTLVNNKLFPVYFIAAGVLLLYLPIGKLKHTVYFFAARYQLGVFYGRRGVWPPKQEGF